MVAAIDKTDDLVARLTERLDTGALDPAEKLVAQRCLSLLSPAAAERWAALAGSDIANAARFLARAVLLAPQDFRFHVNLSNRHLQNGQVGEAVESLKRAALLEPVFPRITANLAALSEGLRRTRCLAARSWACGGSLETGCQAAERLAADGKLEAAFDVLKHILKREPINPAALRLAGTIAQKQRRYDQARRDLGRALLSDPSIGDSYLAASVYFAASRRFGMANRLLDHASCLMPGALALTVNRGAVLEQLGRTQEALELSRQVLVSSPGKAEYNFNVGTTLNDLASTETALRFHERAVLIDPGDLRLRNNLAITLLKLQRYRKGLEQYEYRWFGALDERSGGRSLFPEQSFDLPLWEPDEDDAGRVLLWGEQGLGDEIWGLGYVSALKGRPEQFTVEIDPRLLPLARRSFPDIGFIGRDQAQSFDDSTFDAQLPLLDLPHRMKLGGTNTPSGWARPDTEQVRDLRTRYLSGRGRRLIGLGWRSVKPLAHRSFEFDPSWFSELKNLEDVLFMPLQYGMTDADWQQIDALFGAGRVIRPDFDVWNDIPALADAIAAVDLVVTSATSLVPLAVSVGTPSVVGLKPVQRDWRYAIGTDRSPMLPGATLLWPSNAGHQRELLTAVRARFRETHS